MIVSGNPGGYGSMGALAGGVNAALDAYRQTKMDNANLEIKRQQVAAELELRKLQMAKLNQELQPTMIDFGKVSAAKKMMMGGYVDQGFYEDTVRDAMENIKTPAQAAALNNVLDRDMSARTTNGMMYNRMAGGGPGPDQDPSAPGAGGNPYSDPSQRPQMRGYFNKAERDLLTKSIGYETTANVAAGRNASAERIAQIRTDSAENIRAGINELQRQLKVMEEAGRNSRNSANNQNRMDIEDTRQQGMNTREGMAIGAGKYKSKRGNGPGQPDALDEKSILKQIEQAQKDKNALRKPNPMTGMVPPQELIDSGDKYFDATIQALNQKLQDVRGKKAKNGTISVNPGNPMPGGVPPTALMIRATSKQDIQNAAVGSVIQYGDKVYKKVDENNSLEEVN